MSNLTSYAPPGESAQDLWLERANMDGIPISGVAYGIFFTLTWQTVYSFLQMPRGKIPWSLIGYIAAIFTLGTIGFASNAKFMEIAWIDDRAFPGGPNAVVVAFFTIPENMMGFISFILMSWLADGLMLRRFWLIWGNNYVATLFPALMFLGTISSSTVLIFSVYQASDTFWSTRSTQFAITYWSLSISLNVLLATSISLRIWTLRRRVQKYLGAQHASRYVSVVSMLIESAALYAIFGLVYIITYARNSPVQNTLLPILGEVQGIAPMLILFRVAQGRAWSQNTLKATTTTGPPAFGAGYPLRDLSMTAVGNEPGNMESSGAHSVKVTIVTDTSPPCDEDKSTAF